MKWTDATDALLIAMMADGLHDGAISERFWRNHNIDVSRNSVIGRRARLRDLGRIPPPAPRPPGRAATRKSRAKPDRHHPWRGTVAQAPSLPVASTVESIRDELFPGIMGTPHEGIRLIDLGPCPPAAERCRFPLGDLMAKAEFFCGRAVGNPTNVYCPDHAAVAFNGRPTRRY